MARSMPGLLDQIEVGNSMAMHPLPTCCASAWLIRRAASAGMAEHAAKPTATATAPSSAGRRMCAQPCIDQPFSPRWFEVNNSPVGRSLSSPGDDHRQAPYLGVAESEKLAAVSDTLHLRTPGCRT